MEQAQSWDEVRMHPQKGDCMQRDSLFIRGERRELQTGSERQSWHDTQAPNDL